MRRLAAAMSAIGLATGMAWGLWAWLAVDRPVVEVAAESTANATPDLRPAVPVDSPGSPTPSASAVPLRMPLSVSPAATAAVAVPITVSIPPKLVVGEMNDLVIGLGANGRVREIAFVVQFDANMLQVRAASQGDWAVDVGVNPRFAAEISAAEDRVRIRSALSAPRASNSGGSVAVVQFQPIATGTASVLITDVVVKDADGKPMRAALSASNLQVTVGS